MDKESEYLSIREVAQKLCISYDAARDLVHERLPYVKVGRIYRVRRELLEKYIRWCEERQEAVW